MKTCRKDLHTYDDSLRQCPKCYKDYKKKYYNDNIEEQRLARKLYKENHKAKIKIANRKWLEDNRGIHNSNVRKREAAKLQRTPKWLTELQLTEIKELYIVASELSWLSEGGLHVDHVVPLQGKEVSGLHVPWNLQIIPAYDNWSKSNDVK